MRVPTEAMLVPHFGPIACKINGYVKCISQVDQHRRDLDASRQDAIIALCEQGRRNAAEWLRRAQVAAFRGDMELARNLEAQAALETTRG